MTAIIKDPFLAAEYRKVTADLKKAGLPLKESRILAVEWSSRMSRTLGKCICQGSNCHIRLSASLKERPETIRNVLAHELIHTLPDCRNHGERFQMWGKRLSTCGYHIETHVKSVEYRKCQHPVGVLKCDSCGRFFPYFRKGKVLSNPESYRCRCGGSLARVSVAYYERMLEKQNSHSE